MRFEFENQEKLSGIELTLSIGCKLNCRFCPQEKLINRYMDLSENQVIQLRFEDFQKILDNVKQGGTICFSGMSEPFSNRNCAKMMQYAYHKGYKIMLLTTLVGMTTSDFEMIKNIKLDHFTLHLPDEENNSKFIITEEYLQLLKNVIEKIPIDAYSCHGTLHHKVKDIVKKNVVLANQMMDRAGNLEHETLKRYTPKNEIICIVGTAGDSGNWSPEVLPDGTTLLCCMDYGMEHVLGNLIRQSWAEIKQGDAYQYVLKGMKDDRLDLLCRRCHAAKEKNNLPAMKLKTALNLLKNNPCATEFKGLNPINKETSLLLLNKLVSAKHIAIFGIGKLFWNKYFEHGWQEAIGAEVLSDNNELLWDRNFNGIKCISPKQLLDYEDLLVITHIKEPQALNRQLDEMGIENYISIYDLYKTFI